MSECKYEYCDGKMRSIYYTDGGEYALEVHLDGGGRLCFDWSACGCGDWREDVPIAYCPFCGRRLAVE